MLLMCPADGAWRLLPIRIQRALPVYASSFNGLALLLKGGGGGPIPYNVCRYELPRP
jgi:hypothetical protein